MAGVKVTFKVGNRRGVMNLDEAAQESFVDAMGEEVDRKAGSNFEVDVPRMQRVLNTRIQASLKQAITFAAMNMIGVKSNVNTKGRAAPTDIVFNMGPELGLEGEGSRPLFNPSAALREVFGSDGLTLQWQALSRRTIIKKSGSANRQARDQARKFFHHTGTLQREIKDLAANVVNRTGTVKIYYAKNAATKTPAIMQRQRRVRVGQLQLRFLPGIPIRTLKGFLADNPSYTDGTTSFERSLGLSKDTLMKLQGKDGYHRPLLQPVFSYWMLTRIPKLVGAAISNSIRTR